MNEREVLAKLRERIAERQEFAEHTRAVQTSEPSWSSRAYWTGAADGYNLALAALDALTASLPAEVPYVERWPQRCAYYGCDVHHMNREERQAHLVEVHRPDLRERLRIVGEGQS